ncbi:TPA: TnpV protein [Enterococcus faecium]|uniref:TnpV protein n=1 Tax=Bacillota TaxID=1239 RepID=UPI001C17C0C3|nr:TnpV protein [Blautia massiliensis (ex Durand et al. 2017)]HAQ5929010.1 TnpV protein [Enterococcus faecium]HBG7041777.1 TnpV protein [Clostridioides difficile]HBK6675238.1 TnpV protein [Enterococcus faecium]
MAGTFRIKYREENGIKYPVLEEEMSEEQIMVQLNRYGRRAAIHFKSLDPERYQVLLLSGNLLPMLQKMEKEAEEMHDRLMEQTIEKMQKAEQIRPEDTMAMTNLRTQADMEVRRQVIEEMIQKLS